MLMVIGSSPLVKEKSLVGVLVHFTNFVDERKLSNALKKVCLKHDLQ